MGELCKWQIHLRGVNQNDLRLWLCRFLLPKSKHRMAFRLTFYFLLSILESQFSISESRLAYFPPRENPGIEVGVFFARDRCWRAKKMPHPFLFRYPGFLHP